MMTDPKKVTLFCPKCKVSCTAAAPAPTDVKCTICGGDLQVREVHTR